jgi:hypothetical protein
MNLTECWRVVGQRYALLNLAQHLQEEIPIYEESSEILVSQGILSPEGVLHEDVRRVLEAAFVGQGLNFRIRHPITGRLTEVEGGGS